MIAHVRGLIALGLVALSGCGAAAGSSKALQPSSPFTADDAKLFQGGIDLVGQPAGLDGRWADDWAQDMRARVQRSDLVALVKVDTLRTDITPEQHTRYWLDAEVKDVWKGTFDAHQLSLPTSQDDAGFESVDQKRNTVLNQPLIVLAKWEMQPNGQVRPRWFVTLASDEVVATVRAHLHRDTPDSNRVIERHYTSSH